LKEKEERDSLQVVLLSQQFLANEFGDVGEGPELYHVGDVARAYTITEYSSSKIRILFASRERERENKSVTPEIVGCPTDDYKY
jgi:hypothetical protein